MVILPIHQRLAELWTINKQRPLSPQEMSEMQHCLAANTMHCWQMAYQENLSLMASMTKDVDWQHEICVDIDDLNLKAAKSKKKPGRKNATD